MNFQEAERLVSTARDKRSKPIGNNTRVEKRDEDTYAVRLHATDVVIFHRDGRVVLNTGGWFSPTTKDRMGYAEGVSVYSDKGQWYVGFRSTDRDDPEPPHEYNAIEKPFMALNPGDEVPAHECQRKIADQWGHPRRWCTFCHNYESAKRRYDTYCEYIDKYHSQEEWERAFKARAKEVRAARKLWREWRARNRYEFFDGITFQEQDGRMVCLNAPEPAVVQEHDRQVKEMKARIAKYLKLVQKQLCAGLDMPGPGDCWYCALSAHDGKSLGDAVDTLHPDGSVTVEANHEHLLSHMEEGYVVPSLLWNAMLERYRPEGAYLILRIRPEEGTMGGHGAREFEPVLRALRQYLYARLVPNAPPSTPAGAAFRHYEERRR